LKNEKSVCGSYNHLAAVRRGGDEITARLCKVLGYHYFDKISWQGSHRAVYHHPVVIF
jgi:hypothetical protein